jgi:hypothetical protein
MTRQLQPEMSLALRARNIVTDPGQAFRVCSASVQYKD